MNTKRVHVTLGEGRSRWSILEAGDYTLEVPSEYDETLITAEDVLMDPEIVVVDEDCEATCD